MGLILDTSILVDIERKDKKTLEVLRELRERFPSTLKISFMTLFEFLYGLRYKSQQNRVKYELMLENFEVIHTTSKTAKFLALLKEKYELPLADLFIASQVMESGGILITKDQDFNDISEIDKIII